MSHSCWAWGVLLLYSLLKRGLYLSTGLWQSEKNLPDIPKNTDSLENPCIFPKVTERDDSEEEKVEEKKRDRGDRLGGIGVRGHRGRQSKDGRWEGTLWTDDGASTARVLSSATLTGWTPELDKTERSSFRGKVFCEQRLKRNNQPVTLYSVFLTVLYKRPVVPLLVMGCSREQQ